MKMNSNHFYGKMGLVLAASAWIGISNPMSVPAAVKFLPGVTAEMSNPSYWVRDLTGTDDILADQSKIALLNQRIRASEGSNMFDLDSLSATINAAEMSSKIRESTRKELAAYATGGNYSADGSVMTQEKLDPVIENCFDPTATASQSRGYGICVKRTDIRAYPSLMIIADDPGDNDFDNGVLSALLVNEPVRINFRSADGAWLYITSELVAGWVKTEDIAICHSRNEWKSAWDIAAPTRVVVTAGKVYLEESQTNPDISERMLTMGTILEAADTTGGGLVANRSPYQNYPVYIPVRQADGTYAKKKALISQHNAVSEGYLPLTTNNILKTAYSMLGDTYGWGGMLSSVDCSFYIRNIYRCFGLNIARNTSWQASMPVHNIELEGKSDSEKQTILDTLKPGATLFFKGHEMMYLGEFRGRHYVLSAVSSMRQPSGTGKLRVRSVVVSSLEDTYRMNGLSWLASLYRAQIPYEEQKTE
ncbi:SH3 domain-containing protein [[Clostridium] aminophilum]|uniref:SH3 domain-containing protein n=1 Tax=[Clostridium] aminophilum TaxID=1526 RepID=UPI0033269FEB